MHILIIEDNKEIVFALEKILKEAYFNITTTSYLKEAKTLLEKQEYNLIILDWMLPDGDGIDFLNQIRDEFYDTSVLLLSSKSEIEDKVIALDSGADDYLAKPFSNIELLARVRALLRRESPHKKSLIQIESLIINLATHQVTINHQSIKLTKKEFEVLELLVLNRNSILTRYQINNHINQDFESLKQSNLVDVHIKNLRKKLASYAYLIETVRGVGFTFK